MGNTAKTDNFLKAIKKYTNAQKNLMQNEVKQLKQQKKRMISQQGKRDSEKLIKESLAKKRSEQTTLLAKRTQQGQRELFLERVRMTDEVFELAAERLKNYADTADYRQKLLDSAHRIAQMFGSDSCVIYISERDMSQAYGISGFFGGNAEIKADKTIEIGGIKGYCKAKNIIADDTLDSKLAQQREWFIENADLRVV